jgi:hypothetical protein
MLVTDSQMGCVLYSSSTQQPTAYALWVKANSAIKVSYWPTPARRIVENHAW